VRGACPYTYLSTTGANVVSATELTERVPQGANMATNNKRVSTGWDGLFAGAESVRLTATTATPADILTTAARIVSVGSKVHTPGDGTPQTGRFTGLHVMEFQDTLYTENTRKGRQYSDAVLIALWKAEFPTAKCKYEDHASYVKSARADFNRNKRGMKLEQFKARTSLDKVPEYFKPVTDAKKSAKKAVKAVKKTTQSVVEEPVAPAVEAAPVEA
jgi:hypothetical protein